MQPNRSTPLTSRLRDGFMAIIVSLSVAMPIAGFAFESQEHREMGTIAIGVAKLYAGHLESQGDSIPPEAGAAIDAFSAENVPLNGPLDGALYGYLVECVDFFLYPEKMLAHGWRVSSETEDKTTMGDEGLPDGKGSHLVSSDLVKECDKQGAAYMQASHNNHAHFQQDLMMSLRLWHFMAVALAQQEHNYYGALFLNAIADHYLHDFFAPGHIVTPRDRLTDLPATATHDLANQMGAVFVPTPTPEIEDVLRFLCAQTTDGEAAGRDCVEPPGLGDLLRRKGRKLQIDGLQKHVPALLRHRRVLFRGDGFLGAEEQGPQRVLLLAVQVASILDVLRGKNTFTTVKYAYALKSGVPSATLDFGSYDFSRQGKTYAGFIDTEPAPVLASTDTHAASGNSQPSRFTPCSLGGCKDRLYELRTRAPIISFSNQRESQSSGAYSARDVYNVELSTFGRLWDLSHLSGRWLSGVEVSPVFGYSIYRQGEARGNGPTLRLSAAIPETEFSLGPYVRWLSYPVSGEATRKLSYGLRLESGFSSYFTFYVTGGVDYGTSVSGTLQRGRVWSGGLRVGVPLTRLMPSPSK